MSNLFVFGFAFCLFVLAKNGASMDYGAALTKSLLYYEAQRSGKLPGNQRVQWRGDSALHDGKNGGNIDLVGGYYDAGDNVKFGLPMAFTVTMLSWSVVEFGPQLQARHELKNALNAIKWGTDYLIKAHPQPNVLYGQVGEGGSDHACWQRPEEMTTPRTVFKIDEQHPGADLAGETAAALAAAAVAFKQFNSRYSSTLINHAKQLFDFAKNHPGEYHNYIPAGGFYSSSGYEDELLWAAAWLARATNDKQYLHFIDRPNISGGTRSMFSWDDKYIGAQVLITKSVADRILPRIRNFDQYKASAEQFICNCMQKGNGNVQRTGHGLLWFQEWNNLQYVTSATFITTVYAELLAKTKDSIHCPRGNVWSSDLFSFTKSQVDYILGSNPKRLSYMVGFGNNYPKRVHHRGASIVSIKKQPAPVGCQEGFDLWFHKNADNPNVIHGAIVGGPNQSDEYGDVRENYQQAEPATANTAPFVGVLARLA
ncbi:endoglucanase 12-like [Primulina huaijiensis]|uniref:endoglucanase 12-like n=1 Tax=Primulina huaijiensis TaxID=1492673 RepID=UPI003CC7402A